MKQSLAWLWLIGAVLYAVSAWLFADAVSVVGRKGQNSISSSTTIPPPFPAPVSRSQEAEEVAEARTESPTSEPSLAPGLPVPDIAVEDDDESTEKLEAPGAVQAERFVVRSAANIRSKPSSKSTLIGTAPIGAELEVAEREAGWVRFVDPATSYTGRIHEGLFSPKVGVGAIQYRAAYHRFCR